MADCAPHCVVQFTGFSFLMICKVVTPIKGFATRLRADKGTICSFERYSFFLVFLFMVTVFENSVRVLCLLVTRKVQNCHIVPAYWTLHYLAQLYLSFITFLYFSDPVVFAPTIKFHIQILYTCVPTTCSTSCK